MTYDRLGKPVEGTLEIFLVSIFKAVIFEASISVLRWTWGSTRGPNWNARAWWRTRAIRLRLFLGPAICHPGKSSIESSDSVSVGENDSLSLTMSTCYV